MGDLCFSPSHQRGVVHDTSEYHIFPRHEVRLRGVAYNRRVGRQGVDRTDYLPWEGRIHDADFINCHSPEVRNLLTGSFVVENGTAREFR